LLKKILRIVAASDLRTGGDFVHLTFQAGIKRQCGNNLLSDAARKISHRFTGSGTSKHFPIRSSMNLS
jgi:hypothetical protein